MAGLEGVWVYGLGEKGKEDKVNRELVDFFLCMARHVVYVARTLALYCIREGVSTGK